jgi:hypothetical protein
MSAKQELAKKDWLVKVSITATKPGRDPIELPLSTGNMEITQSNIESVLLQVLEIANQQDAAQADPNSTFAGRQKVAREKEAQAKKGESW